MTDLPEDPPRSAYEILADLLDLAAVIERQAPCHRYVSTRAIRELITSGLKEAS